MKHKTKAQQLGITEFPYIERDKNGNPTYFERGDGFWVNSVYDDKGKKTYLENSNGVWYGRKYDNNGNETYREYNSGTKEYTII